MKGVTTTKLFLKLNRVERGCKFFLFIILLFSESLNEKCTLTSGASGNCNREQGKILHLGREGDFTSRADGYKI